MLDPDKSFLYSSPMGGKWDVIILGAGPAGASAALELKRGGIPRVLILDKARFPRAKVCAGGLGPRARKTLTEMGLWDEISPRTYPIRGARIATTKGRMLHLGGVESAAVLPRADFDSFLVRKAAEAGAEFRDSTRAAGLVRDGGRVRGVILPGGVVEEVTDGGIIIAANGANTANNPYRPRGGYLATAMARFEGLPFEPNHLELIFDPLVAPHYLWIFPETENRVNVGTAVLFDRLEGRRIMDLFDRVLTGSLGDRLAGATEVGRRSSFPITGSRFVRIPGSPGLLCIGEAARLVNLFTGEGIPYALESGRAAARLITERLLGPKGACENSIERELERRLHRRLGPALFSGHLLCSFGHPLLNTVGYLSGLTMVTRAISAAFS